MEEHPDDLAHVEPANGWVASALREEFGRLGLTALTLAALPGRSPWPVRSRLKGLSDRFRGPNAILMRQQPVPHAYRVFFRQVGLDPDVQRPPGEALAVARLLHGEFRSQNLLDDALTIALVETGVPVWALDADRLCGELGLRLSEPGEKLGHSEDAEGDRPIASGRIVVADEEAAVSELFADPAPDCAVTLGTTRMTLYAVGVPDVPGIHVEEALWTCVSVLRAA